MWGVQTGGFPVWACPMCPFCFFLGADQGGHATCFLEGFFEGFLEGSFNKVLLRRVLRRRPVRVSVWDRAS